MKKGFTLIELSIVLVIIGLIVGGVLIGRDLIYNAEVRAVISQFEKFDAAANTFKNKFNCIPGDCARAEDFGLGSSGGPGERGDGDGYVGGMVSEPLNFFYHLMRANLVADSVQGASIADAGTYYFNSSRITLFTPALKMNAVSPPVGGGEGQAGFFVNYNGLQYGAFDQQYYAVIGTIDFLTATGAASLFPEQAYSIDAKKDDGLPYSGTVKAIGDLFDATASQGGAAPAGNGAANLCVLNTTTPNTYNYTSRVYANGNMCALAVRASF